MGHVPVWILAALASAWLGCASAAQPERHWEKPGADAAQLEREREACIATAMDEESEPSPRYGHQVLGGAFLRCMKGKGWVAVEN
ncbi:MAG: hypothetical protein JRH01_14695 [Deltaproteobacteria bacterium]|nr:hypothetical protein [Deltaproteobacteria bacterium]MBW2393941.1 hypothetical protein [Deltaproteobacteria bacterium]